MHSQYIRWFYLPLLNNMTKVTACSLERTEDAIIHHGSGYFLRFLFSKMHWSIELLSILAPKVIIFMIN